MLSIDDLFIGRHFDWEIIVFVSPLVSPVQTQL